MDERHELAGTDFRQLLGGRHWSQVGRDADLLQVLLDFRGDQACRNIVIELIGRVGQFH
jgi:hypothetical protein